MIKETTADPVASTAQKPPSLVDVIKNSNFAKLWGAQVLSQTAQQIVNFALVLQVASITKSSTATSGIIIAFTVPAILFAAIAGVFVERNSKKLMLVLTNILRGVMVLAFLFTDPRWGVGAVLPIFYTATFLFASVSQFFNPAEAALIPQLVKKRELVSANALFNLTLSATQLGGFVVLGPLLLNTIFHNNYNGLYFVCFLLCIAAAGMTYLLPNDAPTETLAQRRARGEKVNAMSVAAGTGEIARSGFRQALSELVEGWSFIRRDQVIMSAILYWSIAIAVFMMLGTIGPNFLKLVLGVDESKLFYILLPGGIGLVVGVLLVGRLASERNREAMINWNLFFAGITLLLFALVPVTLRWFVSLFGPAAVLPAHVNVASEATAQVGAAMGWASELFGSGVVQAEYAFPPNWEWVLLALLGGLTLILGLFNSFISVPAQTALQERAPEAIRARVFSAFYTVSNAILIVPVFFAGAMADSFGYQQTVAVIGVAVIAIAGLGLYRSRQRRSSTDPVSEGPITAEEVQAALTAGSPAPRPMPADTQQEHTGDSQPLEPPQPQVPPTSDRDEDK
ncbi:MAG TPA: MFS transporter [Chloroflexia bacterium]|nr:MFS transporter [Chloroflexia bacterium]